MADAHVTNLDELEASGPFLKVRQDLGVEAFGVNAIVFPPGAVGRRHTHERQDELYFVHAGTPAIEIDGTEHALRPGSLAHVPASVPRMVSNPGAEPAVLLVVGAAEGYVGRDGQPA